LINNLKSPNIPEISQSALNQGKFRNFRSQLFKRTRKTKNNQIKQLMNRLFAISLFAAAAQAINLADANKSKPLKEDEADDDIEAQFDDAFQQIIGPDFDDYKKSKLAHAD
jgi:hypothetical protein